MKDPKQDRLQSGAQEARPKAPGTTSNSTNWKADLKASLSKRKGKEEPLSAAPERHQPPAKKAKKETLEEERRASGLNASAPHSSKDRKNALPTLPPKSLAPALLPSTKPGKSAPQTAAAAPVAPRNPFQSARGSVQPAVNPFASKGKLSVRSPIHSPCFPKSIRRLFSCFHLRRSHNLQAVDLKYNTRILYTNRSRSHSSPRIRAAARAAARA